jgi:hypothetical protein
VGFGGRWLGRCAPFHRLAVAEGNGRPRGEAPQGLEQQVAGRIRYLAQRRRSLGVPVDLLIGWMGSAYSRARTAAPAAGRAPVRACRRRPTARRRSWSSEWVQIAGTSYAPITRAVNSASHWRHVAADLAADHTVICPDLRGYGASDKPAETDGTTYSKRTMAITHLACLDVLPTLDMWEAIVEIR